MRLDRAPIMVLFILAALAVVQVVHFYPLLPERIAVHFGSDGQPNGWDSKGGFMLTYGIIEAVVILIGLGLAFAFQRIPAGLVNIPHRHYWLAPERRAETAEFLGNQVVWLEVLTLGFLIAVAQLTYVKNLGEGPPRLSNDFWYVLGAFVAATVWVSARIVARFARRPQDGPSQP